ncbi:two-component system, OmpR family, sensor kinase [Parafrankia irregularis]|uniref:histidine kinase n=1 Tax=Parafrankia irregularis TaxID=795642 RepID=A0A0S4QXD2_9ACTN|nr:MULTISPECIES: HAMP domain-containing sensor histidine kinase [Parafrankia]MBE3203452.1 HAMP domain-containing histidine kinase [Parafrankia sp. CH37]CUU60189.1 two-component system, OmpR family, sensor kinase [Parafrankia irregularis]
MTEAPAGIPGAPTLSHHTPSHHTASHHTASHHAAGPVGVRRRRGPAGWSLRTRLLALLLALLAVMSAVIVLVTLVALRGVLVDQLDERLHDAGDRWNMVDPSLRPAFLPGVAGSGGGGNLRPGASTSTATQSASDQVGEFLNTRQAVGTLGAIIELQDSVPFRPSVGPENPPTALSPNVDALIQQINAAVIDGASGETTLTDADAAAVAQVPLDGNAHTLTIGDHGDYRLTARLSGDGSRILVTGLPMDDVDATLTRTAAIGAAVAALGVLAAAIAGGAIVRRTLRPLSRVAATAARVAELPLHRGAVDLPTLGPDVDTDPRTEVGQVGAALGRMLGHIGDAFDARHASETRMRQFLADASHELRTPLAAISGYAELTRRTRDTVPPDVIYAMGRVESESARMTALVSDLLLLARLDSGRPLVRETVDLSRLVVDAVSDAHVAAPTHRFELDLPSEPVTTTGDPARLHQVLTNLLANARTHTPPGTRVTARLTTQARPAPPGSLTPPGVPGPLVWCAVLQVIDDGPGIPPELLPKVFERFARGDSSRSRAAGSTGLGLSIVSAVVEAHHGRVEVASRPGQTVFTVLLPVGTATGPRYRPRPDLTLTTGQEADPAGWMPDLAEHGAGGAGGAGPASSPAAEQAVPPQPARTTRPLAETVAGPVAEPAAGPVATHMSAGTETAAPGRPSAAHPGGGPGRGRRARAKEIVHAPRRDPHPHR